MIEIVDAETAQYDWVLNDPAETAALNEAWSDNLKEGTASIVIEGAVVLVGTPDTLAAMLDDMLTSLASYTTDT